MDSLSKEIESLCCDLENWMGNLPDQLKNIPLIYLAIPGSHDSMTFSITKRSRISPDADLLIQILKHLCPAVRIVMSRWSKTQAIGATMQLRNGIRYFDLRTATKPNSDDFYFVHGLYAGDTNKELMQIKEFLDAHPTEVVILDFQHFFAMRKATHAKLMELIISIFNDKLLPYSSGMEDFSLNYLNRKGFQVIAIYRANVARVNHPYLWPTSSFPTPWPNTRNPRTLIKKLNKGLSTRKSNCGYVSQCILTPTILFVMKYMFGSLKSKCVIPLQSYKLDWIRQQKPGPGGVNIIISDFIDLQDFQFSREVVSLNLKSAEEDCIFSNVINNESFILTSDSASVAIDK